jgi:predicted ATPase
MIGLRRERECDGSDGGDGTGERTGPRGASGGALKGLGFSTAMGKSATTTGLKLTVRNFRGVREASWTPEGVCALVGPNGSGKSTLLEAFLFVHYAAKRSPKDAILVTGGMQAFMSHAPVLDHPGDDLALARVRFTVEAPEGSWALSFSATNDNVATVYDESLDDKHALDQPIVLSPFLSTMLVEAIAGKPSSRSPLLARLEQIALYRPWELQHFRRQPWSDPALDDLILAPDGANLFVVLQNWRDRREDAWRFVWVIDNLRRIHRSVSGIELRKGAGVLGAQLYAPGDETPLPIKSASNGVLGTLLSLTAAAGGRDGGIVLLDEPDNGLHPSAIRALVDAFRELHEVRNVHVVLATHSPVILNAFTETPEDVWVTEQKPGATFPVRLTELCDPEWLANFRLGNLYGAGFGRQDPLSGSDG